MEKGEDSSSPQPSSHGDQSLKRKKGVCAAHRPRGKAAGPGRTTSPHPGQLWVERPGAGGPEPLGSPARGAALLEQPLTHSPLTHSALCPAARKGPGPPGRDASPVPHHAAFSVHVPPRAQRQKHSWPGEGHTCSSRPTLAQAARVTSPPPRTTWAQLSS